MKHFDKAKRTVVIMVVLCALIAQGCFDNNSANQSLAGIPLSGKNTESTESSAADSAILKQAKSINWMENCLHMIIPIRQMFTG